MSKFTDANGTAWTVNVRVAEVKACRKLLGVDIPSMVKDGMSGLAELLADPIKFVDVLYLCCKDDADARGLTDEDFAKCLSGNSITSAAEAFLSAFQDFFPDPAMRNAIGKVIATGKAAREKVRQHLTKMLEKVNPEEIASIVGDSLTKRQESSASTPGLSHSTN